MRVCVIGAGVIGAACAAELAKRGADVTVLDAGFAGATAASFGWVNGSFYLDRAHFELRHAGMAAYARLASDLDLPVSARSALWWEEQGAELEAFSVALRDLGYDVAALDVAAVQDIEPALTTPPDQALHFTKEFAVEPLALSAALLKRAQGQGARVLQGTRALALLVEGGRISGVRVENGQIACEHVVVAAGVHAPALLQGVGVALPMKRRPAVNVITERVPFELRSILVTPEGEVRQMLDGRLMSPASVGHQGDTAEEITAPLEQIAARTCARIAPLFGLARLNWQVAHMAQRPVPGDDRPVIGSVGPDGCHVAVMHSGITLAAITAEVIAAGVFDALTSDQENLIAPYTPARFA